MKRVNAVAGEAESGAESVNLAGGVGRARPQGGERPLPPLYYDGAACGVCGADGHDAFTCPVLDRVLARLAARVDAVTLAA